MAQSLITPLEVDQVRVTTVVDNTIDVLMASSEVAERYILGPKWLPIVSALPNPLERQRAIAEHGFSALIQVKRGRPAKEPRSGLRPGARLLWGSDSTMF